MRADGSNSTGVPIVYPRMSIAENILSSKLNPLNLVAKLTPNHLAGYTNKFDQNVELLDDLVSLAVPPGLHCVRVNG